jgi:hypothetical protein
MMAAAIMTIVVAISVGLVTLPRADAADEGHRWRV